MKLPKTIKIMPEYQCYPLWITNIDEEVDFEEESEEMLLPNINPDWLPISMNLKKQIKSWNNFYQNTFIDTLKIFKVRDVSDMEKSGLMSRD